MSEKRETEGQARALVLEPGVRLVPLPDSIEAVINNAARDLPEDFVISLKVERGAAWVELQRMDYRENPPELIFHFSPDGGDVSIPDQISECLEKAKEQNA